jgi:hypothetical protein
LADRRLVELRAQVGNLTIGGDARLTFDEVAERWKAVSQHGLKPSTVLRRVTCIKNLSPFFAGMTVRNIQAHHCERWLAERGPKKAPQTLVHELDTMRLIFDYAILPPPNVSVTNRVRSIPQDARTLMALASRAKPERRADPLNWKG